MSLFFKLLALQRARNFAKNCCRILGAVSIFLLLAPPLIAQDKLQEIYTKIKTAKNDSIKAEAYLDLGFEYFYYSIDSLSQAMQAAEASAGIAKKNNLPTVHIAAYNLRSMIYREKGDYEKSIAMSKMAIEIAKKNNLTKKVHQIEDNMANALFDQGQADEALRLKIAALKAFKKMGDTSSALIAQFGIAYIYLELEQYKKAKEGFLLCKNIAPSKLAQIEVDGNLGIIYGKLDMLDSAIFYMEKAAIKGKDYRSFYLQNQVNLAEIIHKQGNIQKALTMLLDIKDEYQENTEERDYQYYNLRIAEYYTELNNWEKAQDYLQGIDTNIVLYRNQFKKTYGFVGHQLHLKRKDYKEALRYYTIYRDAIDSMENARIDSNFREIASKYELSEKQATISNQKLKIRNYSLGFVSVLGLLGIGGVLFIGYRRKEIFKQRIIKEKTEKQNIEIENLRKENKIISLQSMIEGQEEERKRIARDLQDNISTLLSSIKIKINAIESLEKMHIATELNGLIDNASQQVRRISYSMTPMALDILGLRQALKDVGLQLTQNDIELNAQVDVLDQVEDKELALNIYRILQELMQNILKHSRASEVSLDISKRENELVIHLRDNGIGLSEQQWSNPKSSGIKNIKARVHYLNGRIELLADIGTHIQINIPLMMN